MPEGTANDNSKMTFRRRKRADVPSEFRDRLDGKCCRLFSHCPRCKTEFTDDAIQCGRCGTLRFCTKKIGINGYDKVSDLLGLPCVSHGGPKDPDAITSMLEAKIMPRSIAEIATLRKKSNESLSLEENISIAESRLYDLIGRIGTNNSDKSWEDLERAVYDLKTAIRGVRDMTQKARDSDNPYKYEDKIGEFQRMQAEAIQRIIAIVDDPMRAEHVWSEINQQNARVADLKQKENKIIVDRKLSLTPVETMAFLGQLKEMVTVSIAIGIENLKRSGVIKSNDAELAKNMIIDVMANKITSVVDQVEE